jgi:hypothetical protein
LTDPVQLLTQLLGPAVLLAWPRGSKGTKRKWKHLTLADMTPEYLAKLGAGNIGVALGEVSRGLCAIDADTDDFAESMLAANPALNGTLQTHGARGRVFWLRFKGDYPKRTIKLKTPSGENLGEFRSNGAQSIIWGLHPGTQRPYSFVVQKPVVEIAFHSLIWPEGIEPPLSFDAKCTESTERTERTEVVYSVDSVDSVDSVHSVVVESVEDALHYARVTHQHQSNDRIFSLVRAIKTLERNRNGKFTPPELRDAFNQWYEASKANLRPGNTKQNYFLEFMRAYECAKRPIDESVLDDAWARAVSETLPTEALEFAEYPDFQRLIALCRQLQILAGKQPFYLSCRVVQKLFNLDNHTTGWKWLRTLCALRIIEVAKQGDTRRATRYLYLQRIE